MMKKMFVFCIVASTCYAERDIQQAFNKNNIAAVVVLGGGPAGYTAGMYTARASGFPTYIFTGPNRGGQLMGTTWVDNYPGVEKIEGSMIPEVMAKQALDAGAVIIEDTVNSVDFDTWPFKLTTENGLEVYALTVIVATGATPKKLGIPGEEMYWGSGISSCSLCDGGFFTDQEIVIVGGGDAAIEEATQLSKFATKITVLVRGNKMRAMDTMQQRLMDYPKVSVLFNKQVKEVVGNGTKVTGLIITDSITQADSLFITDGLFLAIGHIPNTGLFQNQLELKPSGHIALLGKSQETSVSGVFAAGDVEDDRFRQAIVSAGRGCQAGLEAVSWLREVGLSTKMLNDHKEKLFAYLPKA